jgi:HAD superfamily hydrolase (TIGR01484 family)
VIKAIITDVDGVIVGKKQGVNFPLPNTTIIKALHTLQKKGIPVVICTAKFNHAVKEIILQADLRNPHITDGGALIIDPLDNAILKKYVFEKALARELVEKFIAKKIYTEVYGSTEYFLQKDHIGEFTEKRIQILQKNHIAVDSLADHIAKVEVIKIINFAHTPQEKETIKEIISPYKEKIHFVWSHHPKTLPSENTIVTVNGVSKKAASLEVLKYLNISPNETLGIGDTEGDWNFMSLCKYVGVVGDASSELKRLAKEKGEGNYFYGSSVDEDGFLQIVDHFIQ